MRKLRCSRCWSASAPRSRASSPPSARARGRAFPARAGRSGQSSASTRAPNTLAALDASTGRVLGIVQIGKRPIGVTSPEGTGKVYTADERSNQLTVVSKNDLSIVAQIPMGAFPHHLMAEPQREELVRRRVRHQQGWRSGHDNRHITAEWEASANPLAKTHAVWITGSGKELYATNEGSTQAVDRHTLEAGSGERASRLWEAPIGARPSEVLGDAGRQDRIRQLRNENALKVLDVSGDDRPGRPAR